MFTNQYPEERTSAVILLNFIHSQQASDAKHEENEWYLSNWEKVHDVIPYAKKVLDAKDLELLYEYAARWLISISLDNEEEYNQYEFAYELQLPYMYRWWEYPEFFSTWHRLEGNLVFWFSNMEDVGRNSWSSGGPLLWYSVADWSWSMTGREKYILFQKLLTKLSSYTSIPWIIRWKKHLLTYAEDPIIVDRITKTLLAMDYIVDDWWYFAYQHTQDNDSSYTITNLIFWWCIYILLLSDTDMARDVIEKFENKTDLPKRDEQMTILKQFKEAC
jgi:hypothetical protein